MTDPDPILDDLRKIRDEYAARFNYDIDAMFEDTKRHEAELRKQGKKFVSYPPRPAQPKVSFHG